MPGQITDQIKTQRSHSLLEIASRMQQEYLSWYPGRQVEVLTEDEIQYQGETWRCGHTKEYVKCLLKNCASNEIVTGKACEVTENHMLIIR